MTTDTARALGLLGFAMAAMNVGIRVDHIPTVPAPTNPVTVEIVSAHVEEPTASTIWATLRFSNNSASPIWILTPIDGSDRDAHMPYYRFTVTDRFGRKVAPQYFCSHTGLWNNTTWPKDYLVEIRPGASHTLWRRLAASPKVAGRFRVDFQYVYEPEREIFPTPPQAWIGTLVAKPISIECCPTPTGPSNASKELVGGK